MLNEFQAQELIENVFSALDKVLCSEDNIPHTSINQVMRCVVSAFYMLMVARGIIKTSEEVRMAALGMIQAIKEFEKILTPVISRNADMN